MYLVLHCKNKNLYALYNSWENNRFGNQNVEVPGREDIYARLHGKKTKLLSLGYGPPFMSTSIFLIQDNALRETSVMSWKAHCKVCLFIRMTPRVSFIQYPRLYSVLHMSQINVRLTSLRIKDVALCPDNLRPIKLTSSAYLHCLLLILSK